MEVGADRWFRFVVFAVGDFGTLWGGRMEVVGGEERFVEEG